MDNKFTKVVLAAIAVLLFVNVGQNAGWFCDGKGKSACSAEKRSKCSGHTSRGGAENYKLIQLNQARKILKIDSRTGEVWYVDTRGFKGWRPLNELTEEEIAEMGELRPLRRGGRQEAPVMQQAPEPEAAAAPEAAETTE
ncbi:MAG: hypothetical protein JRC77_10890 [Deltaproteobacteria bacterium]|nr:hypothetical protein [Deltaproteobacteria bacterium]